MGGGDGALLVGASTLGSVGAGGICGICGGEPPVAIVGGSLHNPGSGAGGAAGFVAIGSTFAMKGAPGED